MQKYITQKKQFYLVVGNNPAFLSLRPSLPMGGYINPYYFNYYSSRPINLMKVVKKTLGRLKCKSVRLFQM